jgi:hypothetical protein
MQEINLDEITDINALKIMKSDQYDALEIHEKNLSNTRQNILNINARMAMVKSQNLKGSAAKIPATSEGNGETQA